MRKLFFLLLCFVFFFCLVSCSTTALAQATQFSLTQTQKSQSSIGLLRGNVNYGAGFYFPTSSDILDISMLKTDASTGLVTEISHQRIRNLLNFPIQFTVRYDESDIGEGDSCTLIVNLLVDDAVKAQGITLITRSGDSFADATLTLLSV